MESGTPDAPLESVMMGKGFGGRRGRDCGRGFGICVPTVPRVVLGNTVPLAQTVSTVLPARTLSLEVA